MSTIVTLNVGGGFFSIPKDKLLSIENTYFALMFKITSKQKDGSYYIDRGYKWFDYVLKYIRDKKVHIKSLSPDDLESLHDEAEFYNIKELVDLILDEKKRRRGLYHEEQKKLAAEKVDLRARKDRRCKKIKEYYNDLDELDSAYDEELGRVGFVDSKNPETGVVERLDYLIMMNKIHRKYTRLRNDKKKFYRPYLIHDQ